MKRNIFISLLIGMMGVIALYGCEKKYTAKDLGIDTIREFIVGEWKCTDSKYKQGGELILKFNENGVIVTNTSSRESLFDNRVIFDYEFIEDTLKMYYYPSYPGYEQCIECIPFIFHLSEMHMDIYYNGMMIEDPNGAMREYNFRKITRR